jgi:signal peptidase I
VSAPSDSSDAMQPDPDEPRPDDEGAHEPRQEDARPLPSGAPPAKGEHVGLLTALRETVVVVAIALALSLLVKTFLVQAFFIPSKSMEDTLLVGDRVIVSKLTPGPFDLQRGDIVVFTDFGGWLDPLVPPDDGPVRGALRSALTFVGLLPSQSGNHLIKRIIGLPGDRVRCCDDNGRVSVNGAALDEPYVFEGDTPSERPFDITVPQGRIWVMGDHRQQSEDSRYHDDGKGGTGSVPIADVTGEAFVLVWPFDRAGLLSRPGATFARVPAPTSP